MESKSDEKGLKKGDKIIVTKIISTSKNIKIGQVAIITTLQQGEYWLGSEDNPETYGWVEGIPYTQLMLELV